MHHTVLSEIYTINQSLRGLEKPCSKERFNFVSLKFTTLTEPLFCVWSTHHWTSEEFLVLEAGWKAGGDGSLKTKYLKSRWNCWPPAAHKASRRLAWDRNLCLAPRNGSHDWLSHFSPREGWVVGVGGGCREPWSHSTHGHLTASSYSSARESREGSRRACHAWRHRRHRDTGQMREMQTLPGGSSFGCLREGRSLQWLFFLPWDFPVLLGGDCLSF